uniref:Uncharacterized protein n=1 Tax=Oryza brachyantha TaxID=4533 RepID=J3MVJ7_ORYBR
MSDPPPSLAENFNQKYVFRSADIVYKNARKVAAEALPAWWPSPLCYRSGTTLSANTPGTEPPNLSARRVGAERWISQGTQKDNVDYITIVLRNN